MKRILVYFSAAALLVLGAASCVDKIYPVGTDPTPVLEPKGLSITVTEKNDTDFTFELAPQGEAAYYSYLVTASDIQSQLDSSLLYAVKYSGVKQGSFKYADAAKATVKVEGVNPNATYYIYAVTSSVEGNVSKVYGATVTTSDGVNPGPASYARNANKIQLTFSEPVSYVEGKEVTAVVYAKNYRKAGDAPVNPKSVAKVDVSGAVAQFTFDDITVPGSWYLVSFPAGTFVDSAGNPCQGISSSFVYDDKGALSNVNGIYGYLANEAAEVTLPTETAIDDLSAWIKVGVPNMLSGLDSKAEFVTTITHVESSAGAKSKTVTDYSMKALTHFGGELYNVLVRPAGTPAPGDEITITIPANAFQDIYGNVNDEIVLGPFQYAYTSVYPKAGDYVVNNGQYPFDIRLVALSEDPAGPYALYANWFDMGNSFVSPVLYMTLDEPGRTLTCNGQYIKSNGTVSEAGDLWGTAFYYYDQAETQMLAFWGGGDNGTDPIVIKYGDDGVLTTISTCEYAIHNASDGAYLKPFDYTDDNTSISIKEAASSAGMNNAARASGLMLVKEPSVRFTR